MNLVRRNRRRIARKTVTQDVFARHTINMNRTKIIGCHHKQ